MMGLPAAVRGGQGSQKSHARAGKKEGTRFHGKKTEESFNHTPECFTEILNPQSGDSHFIQQPGAIDFMDARHARGISEKLLPLNRRRID